MFGKRKKGDHNNVQEEIKTQHWDDIRNAPHLRKQMKVGLSQPSSLIHPFQRTSEIYLGLVFLSRFFLFLGLYAIVSPLFFFSNLFLELIGCPINVFL